MSCRFTEEFWQTVTKVFQIFAKSLFFLIIWCLIFIFLIKLCVGLTAGRTAKSQRCIADIPTAVG